MSAVALIEAVASGPEGRAAFLEADGAAALLELLDSRQPEVCLQNHLAHWSGCRQHNLLYRSCSYRQLPAAVVARGRHTFCLPATQAPGQLK